MTTNSDLLDDPLKWSHRFKYVVTYYLLMCYDEKKGESHQVPLGVVVLIRVLPDRVMIRVASEHIYFITN